MSTDTKFETFWTTLNQCPYELPVEIKPYLQKAIQSAGFSENSTISASGAVASVATVGKVKKLSGYNLYMREKMAELKEQNVPSGERMTKVSVMWKVLTDEEKGTWKVKAEGLTPSTTAPTNATQTVVTQPAAISAPTGPKKLSGYQLYVKETMAVVKANPAIAAKERMGEIGKMWKALNDEQKAAYKIKAETL